MGCLWWVSPGLHACACMSSMCRCWAPVVLIVHVVRGETGAIWEALASHICRMRWRTYTPLAARARVAFTSVVLSSASQCSVCLILPCINPGSLYCRLVKYY